MRLLFFLLVAGVFCSAQEKPTRKERKAQEKFNALLTQRYNFEKLDANAARAKFNTTSWFGLQVSEYIKAAGPYARAIDDGAGGKIIIYESTSSGVSGSYIPGYTVTNGYGQVIEQRDTVDGRYAYSYTRFTDVYVDSKNRITNIKSGTR